MIGVFVTFRYADNFDEQTVRNIAETSRVKFEGMPGLRSKAFTLNPAKREAGTSMFGIRKRPPRRSSRMSCSGGWPVSTACAPASSSCRLPPSWKTPGRDGVPR